MIEVEDVSDSKTVTVWVGVAQAPGLVASFDIAIPTLESDAVAAAITHALVALSYPDMLFPFARHVAARIDARKPDDIPTPAN